MVNMDQHFRLGIVDELQERAQRYAGRPARVIPSAPSAIHSPQTRYTQAEVDLLIRNAVEAATKREDERRAALERNQNNIMLKDVLSRVSAATGFSTDELVGPRKSRALSDARKVACWLISRLRGDLSLEAIGLYVGGRDYKSISVALEQFDKRRDTDPFRTWLLAPEICPLVQKIGSRA